ncbi:four-carbon acid sugar kinase family protein [Zunongwangia sp. HGR-M22]|uniref:four-carbon acid sugar kinase family protein n=1 Tax=Zunongwangia sp. HGR-M22 TaxID=3015168 RepID=UPI0022DE833A|nr:four-carbon acid sugar kinase family protein [Zunongwangia sp. HGR-M22]WBL24675.1 four-carbon acid sugar kinase family protein [Zunongwangia sp. HGR-M22]
MQKDKKLLMVFYGDDFTGSTDALEFMARAGAKTMLFMEPPSVELLSQYQNLDAIGVAGLTRSMIPEEMRRTLKEDFEKIALLNPRHVHYKVCSTFDSSSEIGNIGVAIKEGFKQFKNRFVPILIAAPNLGRYMAFGNLFAQMGIGSDGEIFRIDQHPSMSRHPVTPATEGDLRDQLALQCDFSSGLINLLDLELSLEQLKDKLKQISKENKIVFFDGLYERQMKILGELLEESVEYDKSLFTIGSSGVGKALGDYWQQKGKLNECKNWKALKENKAVLVLSGSASPVTADQIEYALKMGFAEVLVEPEFLEKNLEDFIIKYSDKIIQFLKKDISVIFHTSKGSNDKRLGATKEITNRLGWDASRTRKELPAKFGKILGQTALRVLSEVMLERLIIAGGDTSSYTARELGINAVEMIAPLYKGAPLCKAFAMDSPINNMEINLKGGQVGGKAYFVELQKGKIENQIKNYE